MARKFVTNVDFSGNQALDVRLHQSSGNLSTLASGKVWFDTVKVRPVWAADGTTVHDIYPFATANTVSTGVLRDGNGDFSARIGNFSSVTLSGAITLSTQATTKEYVDALVQGLDLKNSCRCATTTALPAYTFSATGGGTLTANANGAFPTIDTTVTLTVGQSILVKDETSGNAKYNGIYTLDTEGNAGTPWVLVRRYDANTDAEVTSGMYTYISEGTANGSNGYALMTLDPITLNTTALSFSQFSGAGQIIAGTGLSKAGNTLSISTSYVGQTSITTLGTVTTGTWTATAIGTQYGGTGLNTSAATNGQLLIGNGSGLTLSTLTQGTGITITNGAGTITIAATNPAPLDGTFAIQNTADNTKQFKWSLGAQDTGSILTLATSASQATATLTIPLITTSDTMALLGTSQTFTGAKTFTGGVTIQTTALTITDVNVVLSATTGTKIGTATTQKLGFYNATPIVQPTGDVATALTNLGLVASPTISATTALDGTFAVNNTTTPTKQFKWNLAGQTASTILTLATAQSTSQTLNVPNITATDTIATLGLAQSFTAAKTFTGGLTVTTADVTITDRNIVLSATTGTKIGTATTQKLGFYNATPIVQPTGDVATALSNLGLVGSPTISATTALDGTFAVNNTADPTKQFKWSLGNQATGSIVTLATASTQATGTLNIPLFTTSDTLALLGTTQSFTGAKTFTGGLTVNTANMTITDVNIVLSATTGTKIGTATTQKLGFFNATPVAQQTGDISTALSNLGLVTSGTLAAGSLTGQVTIANGGTGTATTSQNYVFAGPATGGAGAPSFRALVLADLPSGSVKSYSADVGDGASLTYVITHNLGTLDIVAQVYEVASGALVECDVVRTSTTQATLTFTTIPTSNQYRVTIVA